jgi:hypothetical protein
MINLNPPNLQTLVELYDSFSGIKYFDKDHTYEINGEKAITSVSGLIGKYEKPFDTKKMAGNVARKEGVSIETILERWEYSKNYSCHKGSEFHLYVENFLERRFAPLDRKAFVNFIAPNNEIYHELTVENYYKEMALLIRNFKSFYDWWKEDHILIKSEFVVGDKKSKVCGTIDNLSFNKKTNEFAIFDYKTNKKINRKNNYGETLLEPFKHISKCELAKYSLQLWLYKIIIERNSPFKVGDLGIVWVAGEDDYELIEPTNYKKEAIQMLDIVS